MPFDLTVEGVKAFLRETPFAASSVVPLAGGYTNFTYRIILRKPYAASGSDAPVRTVVLKHAEPYAAGDGSFPFTAERQDFETLAFRYIPELIYPSPVVTLPKLYYEDCEQRAILMSDSGEESSTLKALLQTTPPTNEVSYIIGRSLGLFLGRLHNSTSKFSSPESEVKAMFAPNHQGRIVGGLLTYGRLIETLSPSDNCETFIEPPIELSPSNLEIVATVATTMQDRIMTNNDVLTMGDFWPGNLLVSLHPEPHINVVDWELTRPGPAGLDIGQFLAECHLLRVFHPMSLTSVDVIVASFCKAYRETFPEDVILKQSLKDLAKVAATRIGAHLIAWTPRIPWGNMEQTRAVVMEGVEYILHAADDDEAWLRTSIVGGLLL